VKTVATEGKGVVELAAAIAGFEEFLATGDRLQQKKASNWRERLVEMLRDSLLERVLRHDLSDGQMARYAAEVAEHKRDPYTLVEEIVGGLGKSR
jgi:LAO/AO transport system kinase